MTLVTESVAASGDDIYASGSTYFATNEQWLWFGNWVTHGDDYNWVRFQTVAIPQGATIVDAKCRFYYTNDWLSVPLTVRIYGNDADDAANPANYTALAAKTKTTAYADWVIPASGLSGYTDTVDFTAVVQEIVDRGGWVSGNDMAFIFDCAGATSDEEVEFYAQDNGSNVPQLVINYQVNQTLSPSLLSQTAAGVNPTVTPGPVTATPALTDQTAAGVNPTVVPGAVTLTPLLVSNVMSGVDPVVSQSGTVVTPDLASQLVAATDPTVAPGPVTIDPLSFGQAIGYFEPTVTQTQPLFPALVEQFLAAIDPTVDTIVTITPDLADQTSTGTAPTVAGESVLITPDQMVQLVEGLLPVLLGGTKTGDTVGVLYRLTDDRLSLVWDLHRGMGTAFKSTEGWEVVSERFVFPLGEVNEVMDAVRVAWTANKAAATATVTSALNDALTVAGYRTPWDTAPNAGTGPVT